MANCGKCGRDLAALTSKGYCLQCDMEETKEARSKKNTLLRTIYENNFNIPLIAKITNRSVESIKEFIKNNNLKKMKDNNYTCSRCHKDTNQLFAKFDYTGLCEDCINKIVKEKAKPIALKEPKQTISVIENSKVKLKDKKINEPIIEFVENTKQIKNEDVLPDTGKPSNMITTKKGRPKKLDLK